MLDIEDFLQFPTINNYWIAYSGGLDSSVLLHLIATDILPRCRDLACKVSKTPLNKLPKFIVVHINHGLSPNAKQWEQHCKLICQQYNLSYQSHQVHAKPEPGQSPEAAARHARYALFKTLMADNDCLITAHHQQDQIETLFLQLFRGAGIKGLSAMPKLKKFGSGYLLRPLLNQTRKSLQDYAEAHQLRWIDDESNFDTNFDRNYIRHELLPVVMHRWPGALSTLNRVTQLCAQANDLMDEVAASDYQTIADPDFRTLHIPKLLELSSARQNNLIRYWLLQGNFNLPNRIKLDEISKTMLTARQDAKPLVHWSGVEIRRYRDALFAMAPLLYHNPRIIIDWDAPSQPLVLCQKCLCADYIACHPERSEGSRSFVAKSAPQDDIMVKNFFDEALGLSNQIGQLTLTSAFQASLSITDKVTVRFRLGGEKIKLVNRQGHHDLKKLFQAWHVPPWQRDRIPLIYRNEELVAVAKYAKNNVVEYTRGFKLETLSKRKK